MMYSVQSKFSFVVKTSNSIKIALIDDGNNTISAARERIFDWRQYTRQEEKSIELLKSIIFQLGHNYENVSTMKAT